MKTRIFAASLLLALLFSLVLAPADTASAKTKAKNQVTDIPVSGKAKGGVKFNGLLDITSFAVEGNAIVAHGVLSGTAVDNKGRTVGEITDQAVTLPVRFRGYPKLGAASQFTQVSTNQLQLLQRTCEILNLELGPLDLDLLGLVIQLDRIDLEITAVGGPGNLLGNLLCAVVNLLNGGGPLQQIANLLNQILAILQGL
jgi:hypothetical protein